MKEVIILCIIIFIIILPKRVTHINFAEKSMLILLNKVDFAEKSIQKYFAEKSMLILLKRVDFAEKSTSKLFC